MEIFISLFALLGGIGVLIIGMSMMSDGLENAAGGGIKKLLQKISSNRLAGFGVGLGVTAIIQSSTATTVLSIGFVNAGVMTLAQAGAIIMGANIGTTVTGLLGALSAFDFSVYLGALSLIGIFMKMFSKNDKAKTVGHILSGIGLVFIGLEFMGNSFKNDVMGNFIEQIFSVVDFPLLLILFSALLTAVIQSSSATLGIVIAMAGAGVIPISSAFFIALGADIGTCFTGIIVSAKSSTNAKRTACFQLIFNLIGVIIFTPILWIFKDQIVGLFAKIVGEQTFQVAFFHAGFNILSAIILLPFLNPLIKLASLICPDKPQEKSAYTFSFIDNLLLKTPNIAMDQTKKEILKMTNLAKTNFRDSIYNILNKDFDNDPTVIKNEEFINFLNDGITEYLISLSSKEVSQKAERQIGAFHHVINDIERIGDYSINFITFNKEMLDNNMSFSKAALEDISNMYRHIDQMFDLAIDTFKNDNTKNLKRVSILEEETDNMEKNINATHYKRIINGECSNEIGKYFYGIISGLERIADHLTNIAFSIVTPSGNEIAIFEE